MAILLLGFCVCGRILFSCVSIVDNSKLGLNQVAFCLSFMIKDLDA